VRELDGQSYYTVGEVADAVGVSSQTLRVWERKGLLMARRSDGGQRLYTKADLERATHVAILRRRHGWNPAAIKSSLADESDRRAWADLSIGMRARVARRAAGLTLDETAHRVGISRSHLSALERGEGEFSQKLLSELADAVGIPVSAFAAMEPAGGVIMRAAQRPRTPVGDDVVWEELASLGHELEPAQMTVRPGGSSGGVYSRPGEIFLLVTAGELAVQVPDDDGVLRGATLREGDSLSLPAASPWSWENTGAEEARAIYVEQLLPPVVARRGDNGNGAPVRSG
jgi:DNA-binding transcriptional MerR regulator